MRTIYTKLCMITWALILLQIFNKKNSLHFCKPFRCIHTSWHSAYKLTYSTSTSNTHTIRIRSSEKLEEKWSKKSMCARTQIVMLSVLLRIYLVHRLQRLFFFSSSKHKRTNIQSLLEERMIEKNNRAHEKKLENKTANRLAQYNTHTHVLIRHPKRSTNTSL